MNTKLATAVIWRGESPFAAGVELVAAVTGLARASQNSGTGEMLQVWIMRADIRPSACRREGARRATCGGCRLKAVCYTRPPNRVWEGLARRGMVAGHDAVVGAVATGADLSGRRAAVLDLVRGRKIRWGADGDPCVIPADLMSAMCHASAGWTGYTHSWRDPRFSEHKRFLMASVESRRGAVDAVAAGWRWFRVRSSTDGCGAVSGTVVREADCPKGSGKLSCSECMFCSGTDGRGRGSASIVLHNGLPDVLVAGERMLSAVA